MHNVLPVIIAGVNKAGTTSLFRYLSDHPSVCGSVVKEARFFNTAPPRDATDPWAAYLRIFPDLSDQHAVCLEATPTYLYRGQEIAKRIAEWFPRARLIFVLRNPVDRFCSFLGSLRNRAADVLTGASDQDIIHALQKHVSKTTKGEDSAFYQQIALEFERGNYSHYLPAFFSCFPSGQIQVLFFEDLTNSPRSFVKRVAADIGISPNFYDDYAFEIENKTRNYRSKRLQRAVHLMNMTLEPFLNRHPALRRSLRTIYTRINENKCAGNEVNAELRRVLAESYDQTLTELKSLLLSQNAALALPRWLP
ncbi:MAG: sulfotransferase family protein [Gammaproteobacteria bacterium]